MNHSCHIEHIDILVDDQNLGNQGPAGGEQINNLLRDSGATDIEADPRFTDAEGGDFTLSGLSPAIDAGNPSAGYNDLDGSPNDLGLYGGPEGS